MKHIDVYDALLLSPYRGAQRLIHTLLLQVANDDGQAWPSIEWLAQHAGCSRRYVEKTLARMRADKIIRQVGKTAGGVIRYAISTPSDPNHSSVPHPNHSSVPPEPQFVQKHREGQTLETQENLPAPAARRTEGPRMKTFGALPPDEPERKEPDRKDTHKYCAQSFGHLAMEYGHARWNHGVVHRTIKELHQDGFPYWKIAKAMRMAVLRNEADFRRSDPALFLRGRRNLLEQYMRDSTLIADHTDRSTELTEAQRVFAAAMENRKTE